jgi:hypothetical protein
VKRSPRSRRFVLSIGRSLRTLWLMTGAVLLALAAIELSASAILSAARFVLHSEADRRYEADAYHGAEWTYEYFRELNVLQTEWSSYVNWRARPFHGRYINIDDAGVRATWTAPAPAGPLVYMLGGSTLWGTGARDEETIPSQVARALWNDHRVAATVVNLGTAGYVSTQEVVKLTLELEHGARPAVVVFYDGVNDTFSAYQNGEAGLPQNEANRRVEFNLSSPGRRIDQLELFIGPASLRSTSTFQLVDAVVARVAGRRSSISAPPARSVAETADAVAARYFANVEHVRRLSRVYGFTPLFFWQPTVFDKADLTAFERSARDEGAGLASLYSAVGDIIDRATGADGGDFRDLRGIFQHDRRPIFIDWAHVGEDADREVAMRMLPGILNGLAHR